MEANKENIKPMTTANTQRVSSLVESPPELSETTPEKGVKNFSTQYLGGGMWPSKVKRREKCETQHIARPDRRQFVSQSLYVAGNDRIAVAASKAARHYQQKVQERSLSKGAYQNSTKKDIKMPPLSLSNALSTAEKNVGKQVGAKITSLVQKSDNNVSGIL